MAMKDIRKKYNVPIHRGRVVRSYYNSSRTGEILSAPGHRVAVRFEDGTRGVCHPYELDYQLADGTWIHAKEMKKLYNGRWDCWIADDKDGFNQLSERWIEIRRQWESEG